MATYYLPITYTAFSRGESFAPDTARVVLVLLGQEQTRNIKLRQHKFRFTMGRLFVTQRREIRGFSDLHCR